MAQADSHDNIVEFPGISRRASSPLPQTSKNGTPEERAAKAALARAQAAARKNPDPAFAMIAEKLAADVAHLKAIYAVDEAERRGDFSCDSEAACHFANEVDWKLANTQPTTLAGVAAVLRFANKIEDANNEWPNTDTVGPEGWHYQLRATMAAALEVLLKAPAGKAVRS
jgi:hypothetical protein